MKKAHSIKYVICIKNSDYEASLEKGKVYRVVRDDEAAQKYLSRIVDESGEDYLYPEDYFMPIKLPTVIEEALAA